MNLVVLIGNLTRDPEVRYTQSGLAVANINIAVNRFGSKEGGPEADFFRVTIFGKQAELAERYLTKGRKVGIEGRIQNDNYEKEGQMVYRDTIIASRLEFLSPRSGGDQFGGGFGGQADDAFARPPGQPAYAQPAPEASPAPAFEQRSPAPAAPEFPPPEDEPQPFAARETAPPQGFSALEDDEDDLPF
jgi:single-strand DNA-binding protein